MEKLKEYLRSLGFHDCGTVDTAEVKFRQEIRGMCEVNTCRMYGTTWACPPAVGTVEECRDRVQAYDKMLVINGLYQLEDSFDFEGMTDGANKFRESSRALNEALAPYRGQYILLSNEGCDLCAKCTYPDAPCRFPEKTMGSLEGYGIFVSELANQAGVKYNNGPSTVTFFGALICNDDLLEKIAP